MRSSLIGLSLTGVLLAAPGHGQGALAQDVYAGKQITMIVGSGAGGGYDFYSRLLARHWGKYIPGKPTFIVQNMAGAGSLVATNLLANTAPRDGLTIGQVQNHMSVEPLMGVTGSLSNVKFDARKLNWLGSAAKEYPLVVAWHTAPVKTFKDVLEREMVVGSSGVATSDSVYPRVMNQLLGTKFRIVDGYKSNPQLILATEVGEIMGRGGWFLSSLMSTQGSQLEAGKYRILVQVALEKHPTLPDVPLVGDFLTDASKRRQLEFALSWLPMGRPFVAPPGVPADRLKVLRDGFMAAVKDPELIAEAKRANAEISPLSGSELQALVEKLYETPKNVIEDVRAIMVVPKGQKK
jgi:tripartite-type tricarboxylate transporter receptor subunit TctC